MPQKIQDFNEALKLENQNFIPKNLQESNNFWVNIQILFLGFGAVAFGVTSALIFTLLSKIFIK